MRMLNGLGCALPAAAVAALLGPLGNHLSAGEPAGGGAVPAGLRTATVTRGELVLTLVATGTLEPEEVVDACAQVAGVVKTLGPDPRGNTDPRYKGKSIDYGSPVEEGSVLAQIDNAIYAAQAEQARAGVARAEAELLQAKARLEMAEVEVRRAQESVKSKALSASDFDVTILHHKLAKASVSVAEAALAQARAAMKEAEINLGYTTVKSPVRGIIIDRRVNVGQSVVAALNAPSLFLVAKDVKKMQVWLSVNEADIGRVRPQQPVRYTVDAFPGKSFEGRVEQIRLECHDDAERGHVHRGRGDGQHG